MPMRPLAWSVVLQAYLISRNATSHSPPTRDSSLCHVWYSGVPRHGPSGWRSHVDLYVAHRALEFLIAGKIGSVNMFDIEMRSEFVCGAWATRKCGRARLDQCILWVRLRSG
jgi:hypothetical protein